MTSPKAILTLDAGDKLASRLKSCINGFLMFSSMTGWATFCGNDTKTSFLYTKMLIKPLLLEKESVWDNKKLFTVVNKKCNISCVVLNSAKFCIQ